MPPIPLSFACVGDVCRPVSESEFHPRLEGDAAFIRSEAPPVFAAPDLHFDSEDDIDRDELLSYLRVENRQDSFIAHLAGALVVPDVMCVIASGDRILFPNTYCEDSVGQAREYYLERSDMLYGVEKRGPRGAVEWEQFLQPPEGAPVYRVEEPHVLLANQSAINYWHFVTEIMPRLWPYDIWPGLRDLPVIVRRKGDAFESALAAAIGAPTSRLFSLDPKALYRFDHLIFPSALCDRALTPAKVAFIRRKLAGDVAAPRPLSAGGRRRLYLSRADRGARAILNEGELIATLAEFGFEAVNPGGLSIREQAALFGEAEMVVGPHGAALTNMLFLPQGAAVLELAARPWGPLFYSLAAACELRYAALGSQWDFYPASRNRRRERRNPAAMLFDPARLAAVVRATLAKIGSP